MDNEARRSFLKGAAAIGSTLAANSVVAQSSGAEKEKQGKAAGAVQKSAGIGAHAEHIGRPSGNVEALHFVIASAAKQSSPLWIAASLRSSQ